MTQKIINGQLYEVMLIGNPVTGLPATSGGTDGSTTITLGGTAQQLFAGVAPPNGFEVINSDPVNDLWISDSAVAVANGVGSIRCAANGGGYYTPQGYTPVGPLSIVGAVTGQKFTAKEW